MRRKLVIEVILVFVWLSIVGCSSEGSGAGNRVGGACEMTNDCAEGLVCYQGSNFLGGYCTLPCDPMAVRGNKSVDCQYYPDFNNLESRCAPGKPEEKLGLCRAICSTDNDCKREEGYFCYGFDHPLVSSFRGSYCVLGGKVGAFCNNQRDCSLDLSCYNEESWECERNGDCPSTQACEEGYCRRLPEGVCTKPCRVLPEEAGDPVWTEVFPGWTSLSEDDKKSYIKAYADQSPDCPAGSKCGPSGLCRPTCSSDAECYANRFDKTCTLDEECMPGGICEGTKCSANCIAERSNCEGLDYQCREYQSDKFCLPISHCQSDDDCRRNQRCDTKDRAFVCVDIEPEE